MSDIFISKLDNIIMLSLSNPLGRESIYSFGIRFRAALVKQREYLMRAAVVNALVRKKSVSSFSIINFSTVRHNWTVL